MTQTKPSKVKAVWAQAKQTHPPCSKPSAGLAPILAPPHPSCDTTPRECLYFGPSAKMGLNVSTTSIIGVKDLINLHFIIKPVNWRELAGCVRILERWGPRLAGKRVVMETDNMAAMWCVRKCKARTRSMARHTGQLSPLYGLSGCNWKWRHVIFIFEQY